MCAKKSMPNIKYAFKSLFKQNFKNFELIVCYDNSEDDGTEEFLLQNKDKIKLLLKLNNKGIYRCLNACILKSKGEIIGLLHSDDEFYDKNVLKNVSNFFKKKKTDMSYSNINYVSKSNKNKIIRRWKAGKFSKNLIDYGWMPPHTSIFIKSKIAKKNLYKTNYTISADYDWILRIIKKENKINYLNITTTNMKLGGISNKNINYIIKKMYEDFIILKKNKINFPMLALALKNLRKIVQFF
jgi:glycosyltransferase